MRSNLVSAFVWLLATSLALPSLGAEKPKIVWYEADVPPHHILETGKKPSGINRLVLDTFITALPEYQHEVRFANTPRMLKALQNQPNACSVSLLKTPEIARYTELAIPWGVFYANGAIYRSTDRLWFRPYLSDQGLDLPAMLEAEPLEVATAKKRYYGAQIESALERNYPTSKIRSIATANEFNSLLRMLAKHHRVDLIFGYPVELSYFEHSESIARDQLLFSPIKGKNTSTLAFAGSAKSALGKHLISQLNSVIQQHRLSTFSDAYQSWLKPSQHAWISSDPI